jgi:CBS domain-containing protein
MPATDPHEDTTGKGLRPPSPATLPVTVADIMRPTLITVEQGAHVAAAAYLMKHAGATALMIRNGSSGEPIGIITETDVAHAVADGMDVNSVRIHDLMTTRPMVINIATSVRDAAEVMTSGHFRHMPVVSVAGLVGIVDITDVCRALIDPAPRTFPATEPTSATGPNRAVADASPAPQAAAGHST